ncbi:MAG TPA: DNA repair helicase XPB [Candidatus Thermoplasmatota archaeon]|nr:DNA repair helicase XPB [Candidatus Thermoplasmatota archaeon]
MNPDQRKPLIIQSDYTLLLEVHHPLFTECRDFLASFAELVKSPEFIHTYKITALSMWNAAALNIPFSDITQGLKKYSRYDIPSNVTCSIKEWYDLYGKLVLKKDKTDLLKLVIKDESIFEHITHEKSIQAFIIRIEHDGFSLLAEERGNVKQALVKIGYPVKDICGYIAGDPYEIQLRTIDLQGAPFQLRPYQKEAVDAFYHAGKKTGGHGIIVLPCGSGKTIIGLGIMSKISNFTLIVSTNNVAVHQWRDELVSKTQITYDEIGEYTGLKKEIKPITITTYQMLTYRRSKEDLFENLSLFNDHNWGLIIYDEVHLLPAPVFRATAGIQAKRRVGLTATLIREDGKEDDVFALIGPKRYDVPWKDLENKGFIAEALCTEFRVDLINDEMLAYAHATKRKKFRIAAENSRKIALVAQLVDNYKHEHILIIGQFISQLKKIADTLGYPLITGKTKNDIREQRYSQFRTGEIKVLVVSKIANFAVDLPDANIMIQVSGTFGSRQEEAQRMGRILRPKKGTSHFFTLVSKGTVEQEFGIKRQLYLVEQGYKYNISYF